MIMYSRKVTLLTAAGAKGQTHHCQTLSKFWRLSQTKTNESMATSIDELLTTLKSREVYQTPLCQGVTLFAASCGSQQKCVILSSNFL